jgi:hypothetical protein
MSTEHLLREFYKISPHAMAGSIALKRSRAIRGSEGIAKLGINSDPPLRLLFQNRLTRPNTKNLLVVFCGRRFVFRGL